MRRAIGKKVVHVVVGVHTLWHHKLAKLTVAEHACPAEVHAHRLFALKEFGLRAGSESSLKAIMFAEQVPGLSEVEEACVAARDVLQITVDGLRQAMLHYVFAQGMFFIFLVWPF